MRNLVVLVLGVHPYCSCLRKSLLSVCWIQNGAFSPCVVRVFFTFFFSRFKGGHWGCNGTYTSFFHRHYGDEGALEGGRSGGEAIWFVRLVLELLSEVFRLDLNLVSVEGLIDFSRCHRESVCTSETFLSNFTEVKF